jgi:hypothetical membrane protein
VALAESERRHGQAGARPLAWFALAGVACYVAIDVLLAFLRPGYSLLYNAESDYGRGPWFWVMDLNFLLRCALSLAVAAALYRAVRPDPRFRGGLVLLAVWAVCSGLLAFFADDLEGQPLTGSGIVHLALAFIAFPCAALGTILISVSLRGEPAWRPTATVLLAVSAAGAAAFLLLGAATGHKHAPGGLYERIFLGIELLWIALAASRIAGEKERSDPAGVMDNVVMPDLDPAPVIEAVARDPQLRVFISDGRITTLPARHQRRCMLLDKVAQAFEPGVRYSERRVSLFLGSIHADYAALRRYLVDEDFLSRSGGEYWRSGGTVPPSPGRMSPEPPR